MVMVSARERPTTSCCPNGVGKFQLRGSGSEGSNLLLEKVKCRPGLRWPVNRVPRVGFQLSSATPMRISSAAIQSP